MSHIRRRRERGGVAVLVALLAGCGVLLGAAALSVDVGGLMVERRQLQNAADASALSLAQSCAKGNCKPGADGLGALADKNSTDGLHTIVRQCGRNTGGTLTTCTSTPDTQDLAECPPIPPAYAAATTLKYVEVQTESRSTEGGFVRNLFSSATAGADTSTLRACARAAWGPPKPATVIPLTFSDCEYEDATRLGFGDPAVDPFVGEVALALKYKSSEGPCPGKAHSGMDAPGAFGWLDDTDCEAKLDADGWVSVDTGKSGPTECLPVGATVLIPIFDCVSKAKINCDNKKSGGSKSNYHIAGFAPFRITGFEFPKGDKALSGHPGTKAKKECESEAVDKKTCLFGMFLDGYVKGTGVIDPDGADYGAHVIQPLG